MYNVFTSDPPISLHHLGYIWMKGWIWGSRFEWIWDESLVIWIKEKMVRF